MIEWLKLLYHRLPIVRELRSFEAAIHRSLRIARSAKAILVLEAPVSKRSSYSVPISCAPHTSENHFEPPRDYLFARCAHPAAVPFFESSTTPRSA